MPSSQSTQLSEKEEEEAESRLLPRAALVFETILREGEGELERASLALALSGLAAGLSMGFSLVALGVLRAALPPAPWRPLVANLGYSVGFLIVILGRQQLFTENTLTPILPLLDEFSVRKFWNVARLWGIVLLANVVGALIFAFGVAHAQAFDPAAHRAFLATGLEAARAPASVQFVKAIFAGWLIALMVWLLPAAESARPWIIIILTWLVGAAGLSHVVAGSVEVGYAASAGALGWSTYAVRFFLPTLAGNILGGTAFVALLNYGQVVADANAPPPRP